MKYASLLPSHEAVRSVLDQRRLQLPSLPLVAVRLLELTLDDHSCAHDLARVIETDPALAAKVLGIVNSAAYGLPRKSHRSPRPRPCWGLPASAHWPWG